MSATIIELQAENVKRIRAVKIVPKSGTVVITGKNDQGKSSVLDSIDYAFRGEKEICDEPLRHGEKRGIVRLTLSQELEGICTIERRFTPGGTTLEVRNAEGVPQKSPQALLDSVISKITFDPLSFTRLKPADQLEMLRKLVGLDFTQINADRKRAFEERTVRGRELESAKRQLEAFPFDPSLPESPISVSELATKLGEVRSRNATVKQRKDAVETQKQKSFDLEEDIKALNSKIATLGKMIADTKDQLHEKLNAHERSTMEAERMEREATALQTLDESEITKSIAQIQDTNARIETNRRHREAQSSIDRIAAEHAALTKAIEDFDAEKKAQIEFAEFPMPGLSFDEDRGVILNGVPFQQASSARQLQAAVNIGLALNPKIRVILIRDGSLLDDESMNLVSEAVASRDGQLWVEVVNSKDPSSILIEDGEIAKQ